MVFIPLGSDPAEAAKPPPKFWFLTPELDSKAVRRKQGSLEAVLQCRASVDASIG